MHDKDIYGGLKKVWSILIIDGMTTDSSNQRNQPWSEKEITVSNKLMDNWQSKVNVYNR